MPIRRDARAFTLIELLVVVAIIALLLAILLPSLKEAKDKARRLVCATNHRQLITAARIYADENRTYMPPPNWGQPRWSREYPRGWLYDPDRVNGAGSGRSFLPWSPSDVEEGLLWEYLKDREIFRCPLHYKIVKRDKLSLRLTSYLMNGSVAGFPTGNIENFFQTFKLDEFRSDGVVFWEPPDPNGHGEEENPAGDWGEDWQDGSSTPDQGLTYRHGEGSTLSFFDGHTEWWTLSQYLREEEIPLLNKLWCNPQHEYGRWPGWTPPDP